MSGQLLVKVTSVANAKAYEGRYALDPAGPPQGPWQTGGLFTNSRSVAICGLTPGTNVWLRLRTAGIKGVMGAWSDPARIMVV